MDKTSEKQQQVMGPGGELLPAEALTLGVEKFYTPDKHYRLIWIYGDAAWLCREDQTAYRRVWGEGGVMDAGKALAEQMGAKRFSGVVR